MSPKDRLLHHIEQHLDDPTLSPGSTAAALGWSLRQVHAVMEGEQLTFMRSVTHLRLCRARSLLQQRQGTVVDVVFACGFKSLATFYRQYASIVGVSPAGRRLRGGSSLEVTTQALPPCTR